MRRPIAFPPQPLAIRVLLVADCLVTSILPALGALAFILFKLDPLTPATPSRIGPVGNWIATSLVWLSPFALLQFAVFGIFILELLALGVAVTGWLAALAWREQRVSRIALVAVLAFDTVAQIPSFLLLNRVAESQLGEIGAYVVTRGLFGLALVAINALALLSPPPPALFASPGQSGEGDKEVQGRSR